MLAPTTIPTFQQPDETISPAVQTLLNEKVIIEEGIQFAQYRPLNTCRYSLFFLFRHNPTINQNETKPKTFFFLYLVDPLELKKTGRSAAFYYRDSNAFLNTKRIFLEITWFASKDDDSALTTEDFVSCSNPPSQHLMESVILNIGMIF